MSGSVEIVTRQFGAFDQPTMICSTKIAVMTTESVRAMAVIMIINLSLKLRSCEVGIDTVVRIPLMVGRYYDLLVCNSAHDNVTLRLGDFILHTWCRKS